MDNIIQFRHELKKTAEEKGIKLTYMPIFLKAASLALLEYPILNSSVSEDETEIIYHGIFFFFFFFFFLHFFSPEQSRLNNE